jgi:CheY-like chemotaxis protein
MRMRGGVLEVRLEAVTVDAAQAAAHPNLKTGAYARLTVRDSGHGMDQATLTHIFEPFFTTKAPSEGTGMGLAVVYGIIMEHGGAIIVTSQPGQGAMFDIYLPLAQQEGTDGAVLPPEMPAPGEHEQILIIDDDTSIVMVLQEILENQGYTVTSASSGAEALEQIRREPARFDLVITDLTMPQMTGLELARALSSLRPNLPVVLITGYGDAISPSEYQAAGIREWLSKPFSAGEITGIIHQLLAAEELREGGGHGPHPDH